MDTWFKAIRNSNIDYVSEHYLRFLRSEDENGITGLMIAAENKNIEIVKLLTDGEHGLRDQNGKYAAEYAIDSNAVQVIEYLLPFEANEEVLNALAQSASNTKVIKQATEYDAYKRSIYKLQSDIDKLRERGEVEPVTDKEENECKNLIAKITELEKIIKKYSDDLDSLEGELDVEKDYANTLKAEVLTAEKKNSNLTEQLEQQSLKNAECEEELSQRIKMCFTLEEEVNEQKSHIKEFEETESDEIEDLLIDDLNEQISKEKEKISEYEARNSKLEQANKELEDMNSELQKEAESQEQSATNEGSLILEDYKAMLLYVIEYEEEERQKLFKEINMLKLQIKQIGVETNNQVTSSIEGKPLNIQKMEALISNYNDFPQSKNNTFEIFCIIICFIVAILILYLSLK